MAAVSVLVPWRGGDPDRERGWAYLRGWWAERHPDWQVVVGECLEGPWRKALAVAHAFGRADGEILVLSDADVLCDGIADAVDAVDAVAAGAPWAVPHRMVYRLTRRATQDVYAGGRLSNHAGRLAQPQYEGYEGGGITVLTRGTYERVPLDPRFAGWGAEDEAWALGLRTLVGSPWRGEAPLWHLFHEPQPRLNRHVGSKPSHALLVRYQLAAKDGPEAMRRLVAEHVGHSVTAAV